MSGRFVSAVLLALLLAGGGLAPLEAQRTEVLDVVEQLDFDDPEAWAMKYFASIGLLTSLGAVEAREPGSVELGLELGSVPHLDREQRTVGFGGLKEEDLNRSPVSARGRLIVGLPRGASLTFAWAPPVRIDGAAANLVSAAVDKVLVSGPVWTFGARVFAQLGEADGDFTCSAEDASFPVGSPDNAFGCEAESSDEVQLDYYGVGLTAARRAQLPRRPDLHVAVGAQHLDLEFQVDARTFGFLDRTLLLADGETFSAAAGASWELGGRGDLGLELFYSPLDVRRAGESSASNDPLLNLRALYRLRLR